MNKQKFLDFVRIVRPADFIFLTFAGIINAVGVTLFLTPATLYDGGFSGTSILLGNVTPLSMSLWLLILNVPFFLFGLKRMGVVFILHSLYAVGIYSLFSFLFQSVFGLDFSAGSPIAGADMLLSALFGGVISGVGSGLTIRFGGAIDGVEVLAVVFAKRIGMTVGSFVMSYNVILYIIAGIVTRDWIAPLYSIVAYTVGLKAVDFVIDGFDKAKSAFIITERHNEVADMLSKEFGRGVTTLDAEGYYSHTPKTVLYCVVNRFEVGKLKAIVTEIDPSAFLVINDVTDSLGSSLKYESRIRRRISRAIAEKEQAAASGAAAPETTADAPSPAADLSDGAGACAEPVPAPSAGTSPETSAPDSSSATGISPETSSPAPPAEEDCTEK